MTELPIAFSCKIRCPNNMILSVGVSKNHTGKTIKNILLTNEKAYISPSINNDPE
jgi:hypothetical protein